MAQRSLRPLGQRPAERGFDTGLCDGIEIDDIRQHPVRPCGCGRRVTTASTRREELLEIQSSGLPGVLSDAYYPGNVLAASGLRRLPVIAIILISATATSLTDDQSTYHSVRLKDAAAGNRVTIDAALDQWGRRQTEVTTARPAGSEPIPLVFVASAGGGIRAAYWTTIVLNCLVKNQDNAGWKPIGMDMNNVCTHRMSMDSVFLASGISGGSLGLAVTKAFKDAPAVPWSEPLGKDFLGPTVAGVAFRDLPNAFVRLRATGQDSAAVLEKSWEKSVRDAKGDLESGFLATAWSTPDRLDFPLLALSGTSVTDGCRVTVSALKLADADAASHDCLSLDRVVTPIQGAHAQLQTLAATKDAFDSTCPADGCLHFLKCGFFCERRDRRALFAHDFFSK